MDSLKGHVYNDLGGLQQLKAVSAERPQEALQEAARQFEALFVTMMVKAMRDTLPQDGLFSSSSMQTYQEMADQQLALDLSRRGGLGMADLIARQLSAGMVWQDTDTNGPAAAASVEPR
jgi:flagellar protein FlgJ